jgi:bile acid:Na+ symporter, BASS family
MSIQLSNSVLAVILCLMMFGLGLSTAFNDFRELRRAPKSIFPVLVAQIIFLPVLAVAVATLFGLQGQLAFGFVLLAATPGGVTAAVYSQFCGGRVALNVALTSINTAIAFFTVPLVVTVAAHFYLTQVSDTPVDLTWRLLQTMALLLAPMAMGMLVKAKAPALAARLLPSLRGISVLGLAILVVVAFYSQREKILSYFWVLLPAVCVLAAMSFLLGSAVAKAFRLSEADRRASTFELGIHNSGLSIYITSQVIGGWEAAVPSATYTIVSYILAALFIFVFFRAKSIVNVGPASSH